MDPQAFADALSQAFQTLDFNRPGIPCFDPAKQDVNEWIIAFNAVTNGKTDQQKIQFLPNTLQNSALRWFTGQASQANFANRTWQQWEDAIKHEFGRKLNNIVRDLHTRQQKEHEKATEFCRETLRLCSQTNPNMTEEEKIEHLMRGIKPDLRERIFLMSPTDSNDFVTKIGSLETMQFKSGSADIQSLADSLVTQIVSKMNIQSHNNRETPILHQDERSNVLEERIDSLNAKLDKFMDLQSNRNQQTTRINRPSRRDQHQSYFNPISFGNPSFGSCPSIVTLPSYAVTRNLISVPATFKHEDYSPIIDSGSRKNIVSEAFVKKNNLRIKNESSTILRVVNGGTVTPLGEVTFDLEIGNKIYEIKALVVNNFSFHILLGTEFCAENGVEINFKTRSIHIGLLKHPINNDFFENQSAI
ncbi:hypothetical protein B4U80_11786, partial [Leptotrombidium deliense]